MVDMGQKRGGIGHNHEGEGSGQEAEKARWGGREAEVATRKRTRGGKSEVGWTRGGSGPRRRSQGGGGRSGVGPRWKWPSAWEQSRGGV